VAEFLRMPESDFKAAEWTCTEKKTKLAIKQNLVSYSAVSELYSYAYLDSLHCHTDTTIYTDIYVLLSYFFHPSLVFNPRVPKKETVQILHPEDFISSPQSILFAIFQR
jgi:hypothetical protein